MLDASFCIHASSITSLLVLISLKIPIVWCRKWSFCSLGGLYLCLIFYAMYELVSSLQEYVFSIYWFLWWLTICYQKILLTNRALDSLVYSLLCMNIFSHFWASYIFGVTNEHSFQLWPNLIIYLVVILNDEMLTWAP